MLGQPAEAAHPAASLGPGYTDSGFMHNTGLTGQLWADGAFMLDPFLAPYGTVFGDGASSAESADQLVTYFTRLRHPSGLLYHAFDERRKQS
ncbi:glycoside hydrolase family 88 protein [Amycolatopsis sp. NBC_00355]|uniref:glycoside hydrolase family 88 protein n=1 Tax=Amycolatopsis sp. NBC_00355 TaxID=2975957 RepID=UPI002E257F45